MDLFYHLKAYKAAILAGDIAAENDAFIALINWHSDKVINKFNEGMDKAKEIYRPEVEKNDRLA